MSAVTVTVSGLSLGDCGGAGGMIGLALAGMDPMNHGRQTVTSLSMAGGAGCGRTRRTAALNDNGGSPRTAHLRMVKG